MNHIAYEPSRASPAVSPTRRDLILHDSVSFLVLLLISLALFGVTLFLFRSFESHRAELAQRWADRGAQQLQAGQPATAVASLRAALSYAPDDYQSQLLLAQALADSGETDQATNYFLNLWSARPGDGLINLQLARLERRKNDHKDAISYYRASIFGDWRGDGSIRRRDVRLELIDYLLQLHENDAARVELLIAAGNAPPNLHLNALFADKLLQTGDPADALAYYDKAIADAPHDAAALAAAGRLVYQQGDYARAHTLLARAAQNEPAASSQREELDTLARASSRLAELSLSRELSARTRAEHLLEAATIAWARLTSCAGQSTTSSGAPVPTTIADLQTRWKAATPGVRRNALAENAAGQDMLTQLIYDTERDTAEVCGKPVGDDELLLKLAQNNQARSREPAQP